jgi:AraC-like DNA-binding protein
MLDYINEAGMARSGASALGNFNIVICILRHLLAGLPAEISIDLQGELTAPRSAVEARFGVRVRYHQPQNRLLCVSPALDALNRQHNPLAQRYLQDSVARERRQLASQRSFLQQVEWQLKARMCSAPLSGDCEYALAEVCQHFAISRWTLLRRLKEEGDTFQSVWARVRGEEAQRLLAETGYSIGEISDRLGFVSQSSLSRFFRAQWGLSPLQFRARRPPVHHSMAPLSVASVDSAAVSRDEVPTFS